MKHKYVTTEWAQPGWVPIWPCVCCGFDMIGDNNALIVRHYTGRAEAKICDLCVKAVRDAGEPAP